MAVVGVSLSAAMPDFAPLIVVASATMADLLKAASHRQQERMTKMTTLAMARVSEQLAAGAKFRDEADPARFVEVFEGALQAARDAFEERKIPLISNLLATAPFTATPIANSVSTLRFVERLTYRQLCLLALLPGYLPVHSHLVADSRRLWRLRYGDPRDPSMEVLDGIAVEVAGLEQEGLTVRARLPAPTDPSPPFQPPESFALTYAGRILANGTQLSQTIPASDLDEIRALLNGV